MNRQMEDAIHSHPQGHSPHREVQVIATGLGKGYIHHLPHTAGGTTEKEGFHRTTIRDIRVRNSGTAPTYNQGARDPTDFQTEPEEGSALSCTVNRIQQATKGRG